MVHGGWRTKKTGQSHSADEREREKKEICISEQNIKNYFKQSAFE